MQALYNFTSLYEATEALPLPASYRVKHFNPRGPAPARGAGHRRGGARTRSAAQSRLDAVVRAGRCFGCTSGRGRHSGRDGSLSEDRICAAFRRDWLERHQQPRHFLEEAVAAAAEAQRALEAMSLDQRRDIIAAIRYESMTHAKGLAQQTLEETNSALSPL